MRLSADERRALKLIRRRIFCADWLVRPRVLALLLQRKMIYRCGFYSVCLAGETRWPAPPRKGGAK